MKRSLRLIGITMALAAVFSLSAGLAGCGDSAPEGYIKESAENMFWEAEDRILEDGTVVPDPEICIYNYAPSIFQEDENTRYAYYCSNRYTVGKTLGENWMDELGNQQVTDYIAFRKGVKIDGEWWWSEKKYVLSPITRNGESNHPYEGQQVCDPNVIKGGFAYNGHTYSYLMAYLACSTRDNQFNNICLAVADSPEGPWKRCEDINPLLKFTTEGMPDSMLSTYLWGYGQASMISLDRMGRVLMFYSAIKPFETAGSWSHETQTSIARYDFSDLNNIVREDFCERMNVTGVTRPNITGKAAQVTVVTNGDYAYDAATGRIYGITDGEQNGAPVFWVENKSEDENAEIGDVFFDYAREEWSANGIQWTTIANVHAVDTEHYQSSHNTCLIRDPYGYTLSSGTIEAAITGAMTEAVLGQLYPGQTNPLWTYRILRKTVSTE